MRSLAIRSLLLLSLIASPSLSQSIYLDIGDYLGHAPSDAYGAAAGFSGHWNSMRSPDTVSLLDTQGQPTIAWATTSGSDEGSEDHANTTGDDQELLDDFAWADGYGGSLFLDVFGLRSGTYQLYLYPHANGAGVYLEITGIYVLVEGGTSGYTGNLGPFPGSYAQWHVPVRLLHVVHDGASLRLRCQGYGLAGIQLVRLADATPFCTGDQGYCPCGVGQPGAGCPSSLSSGGASLVGTGSMQVSADSLQLSASALSNSMVTFFQGTTAQSLGLGATFGDGLRCAGGSTVRLASVQASGGVAQYPGAGDPSVSVRGGVPASGGFRTYQVWYRNAADFCTSATFNLTNGVAVDWRP